MASDYSQSPHMLNMSSVGPTSAYLGGGGSQSGGSEFEFVGTPQSLSIDGMMQSNDMNGHSMPNYRVPPSSIPGNLQQFGRSFDSGMLGQSAMQGGHMQHRGSAGSLHDGHSPVLEHHHRPSIGSHFGGSGRQNSVHGSDSTSPPGNRGHGNIGENPFGSNSNDTVDSQNQGEVPHGQNDDNPDSVPPAWSELKTKAGKERKRLPLACIACRRKKIRCSGEKPACKHCLRSRIPCVYKVTTRKAAPRTDYMAMLDKRLKRMEERVIKVIPKEEQGVVGSTGRAVVKPPLPSLPKVSGSSKKRAAGAAFGDELDEWASSKAAIAAEVRNEEQQEAAKEPLKVQDSEEHNLLKEGADKLPPKEIQEHLAEVFFDYVYCQSYPLLHKPSFMRKLGQGTVPPVLTLAVCAIAARFSNHPSVRTEPAFLRGEDWASAARDIALRRYDTPNITILIVYLILGLHEFGTCQGGRSWMFGGMAQRMAYALQLHRDLDHDPKNRSPTEKNELTFTDREIRRRTMWSCFLMDRFNSSGTDRPIFVGEQYIRAQLPIKEAYYQMEITGPTEDLEGTVPNPVEPDTGQLSDATDNMGVTAYLIRLVAIWGKLINYLNLGGQDRDQYPMWDERSTFYGINVAAKEWKEGLPECMRYTPENLQKHASERIANQFIFLHLVYSQVILFMNRFALPTPASRPTFPKDMPSEFISEASRSAHEAANQISTLVHEAMDYHVVAPFAGYCAFFSSTVHIYGAFSKNPALEASSKQNLAYNVKFLTKMKKFWGMFHFMTENLRDLYRRHADAARSGNKTSGKEGEQAIFQYGDWFDRYPHGVSGTDYEEPSAEIKKEPGADAVLGQKSDLQTVEEFFAKLSPPSRAVQTQQQQSQQRKMAKKRHTKSEAKQATSATQQHQNQQPQQQDTKPILQPDPSMQQIPDMMTVPPFQNQNQMPGYPQQPTNFPHQNLQQPQNPLFMGVPQQQVMSQLDRQMVLNSYAGVNSPSSAPTQALTSANPMAGDLTNNGLDTFDFAPFSNPNGNGYEFQDPSTAWFMPFNMDPPAVGEDNNLFNGGYDWNNLGGFGDLSGMPTGLTPRPDIDGSVGQNGLERNVSGSSLDDLGGMQ